MRVEADVVLKLFALVNESVEPELALEAVEKLADENVADLLELFVVASEEGNGRPGALIKSAIRRLRKASVVKVAEPNS